MVYVYEFFTMAFPKSGVSIGGIGITISLILFPLVIVSKIKYLPNYFMKHKLFSFFYIIMFYCMGIAILINIAQKTVSAFNLSMGLVVLLSPLAVLVPYNLNVERQFKVVNVSAFIVSLFAIIQKIIGIYAGSIKGLTYTWGQNLEDKTLGWDKSLEGVALKVPSTYQNGNGYGLFLVLSILILLIWKNNEKKWEIFRNITIVISIISIFLSGSRSVLYPFIFFSLFIIFNYIKKLEYKKRKRVILSLMITSLLLFIYLIISQSTMIEQMYSRYIQQTLADSTAAGRTTQWNNVIDYLSNLNFIGGIRFIFIGTPLNNLVSEGLLGYFGNYGFFSLLSLVGMLLVMIYEVKKKYEVNLFIFGQIIIVIAFVIDKSFYYPPALMNYFILSVLVLNYSDSISVKGDE